MAHTTDQLIPYLRQYGSHCMAYTTLEPTMDHFILDGVGYIAFIHFKHWLWSWKDRCMVLADPVCAQEDYPSIIRAFIKKHPHVIFVEASYELASTLDQMGYQVNQFGIETELPVPEFNLKGKQRAKLRQWSNKCKREGVEIIEQKVEDVANLDAVKDLSNEWLQKKGGSEYSFLVRPLRFHNEMDVRYFWAYKDKKLIALAVFDPIYKDNHIIGYYHNMDRMNQEAPHGTSASIILTAMEQFKKEGVQYISLGMSPLYLQRGMVNEFNYHPFTRKSFWYAFENLNFIYPFKGNATHKRKFNGEQKPVYFSSTSGTSLKQVFIMLKAMGMF